jgi:hypothetical protein
MCFQISVFEFDAYWSIDFLTRICIKRLNELETFFMSLIYKNPTLLSKFKGYVEVDGDICVNLEFWNGCSNGVDLSCFAGSMVGPTILIFFPDDGDFFPTIPFFPDFSLKPKP